MRLIFRYSPLLLAVLALAAAHSYAQNVIYRIPASNIGCPVGLAADQRGSGEVLRTERKSSEGLVKGVHVSLTDRGEQKIRSVALLVHGVPPGTQLLPAGSFASTKDVTKIFHLVRDEHSDQPLTSDLWMRDVVGIRSVSVIAIEYTTGSSWRPSGTSSCITEPNFLIGALR